jgi:hypothetical protein
VSARESTKNGSVALISDIPEPKFFRRVTD